MNERLLFPYRTEEKRQRSIEIIHENYSKILDEKSKEIYRNRLMITFTGDIGYVRKLVMLTEAGNRFFDFLNGQKNLYVYGAGIRGRRLVQMFPEIKWKGFIDKYKTGICDGLRICCLAEMKNNDVVVLISNLTGCEEIKNDIVKQGVSEKNIYELNEFEKYAQNDMYFEKRCVGKFIKKNGIFLDVGCYDGEDSIRFLQSDLFVGNDIYAFEPDINSYHKCKKRLLNHNNVLVYNYALSNCEQKSYFLQNQGLGSRMVNQGDNMVDVRTIDNIVGGRTIGYIKLDVEGYEKRVLLGARKHIVQDKPNMMISIYHKPEDIIEIPMLLREMNPNYKFALGHYNVGGGSETILYAYD